MAKYEIHHTCGHSRTVQLYGPGVERERKIEWMESQECPQCWGARKREEEAKKPITATIKTNGLDTDNDGNVLVEIVLTGGTMPKKEEIKSLGYQWGEVRGGMMDFLSTKRPDVAWIKRMPIIDFINGGSEIIESEIKSLDGIIENGIGPIDIKMAAEAVEKKQVKDEAKKAIEKPSKPESLPSNRGRWNGKVYGSAKWGYKVYIDGDEEKITNEEAAEIEAYLEARQKYNMAIEKIERGEE